MSPSLSDQVSVLSSQLYLLQEYIEYKFGVDFKEFQSFKETHPCGGFVVVKKSNLFSEETSPSPQNCDTYDETSNDQNNDDDNQEGHRHLGYVGEDEDFEPNDNIGIVIKSETLSGTNWVNGDNFDDQGDVPVCYDDEHHGEGQIYVTGDNDMEDEVSVDPNIGVLSTSSRSVKANIAVLSSSSSPRMPDLTPIHFSPTRRTTRLTNNGVRKSLPTLKRLAPRKIVAKKTVDTSTLVTTGDMFSASTFRKHEGAHRHAEFGIEYKMTGRGEKMLYEDYLFRVNKHDWKRGRIYWLCSEKTCPVRIAQDVNGRPVQNRAHDHPKPEKIW